MATPSSRSRITVMRMPAGYREVRVAGARAFALPGERSWVRELLVEHGTLYEAAARDDGALVLEGRAPVYAVGSPRGRRVVRRYHRGGAVARLLGDRHLRLGPPRPLRETRASREARSRGVPTPRVVAGAIYPAGPFYRADLVTEYLSGSVDLAEVLFGTGGGGPERGEALERTGRLLAHMAAAGVPHPDLNAKNVLFVPRDETPSGGWEAFLLDLDRCRPTADGSSVAPDAMLARLERSLEKLAGARGGRLSAGESERLRAAAHAGGPWPGPGGTP